MLLCSTRNSAKRVKKEIIHRFENAHHPASIINMMKSIRVPRPKDRYQKGAPHLKVPKSKTRSLDQPWDSQENMDEYHEFQGDEYMGEGEFEYLEQIWNQETANQSLVKVDPLSLSQELSQMIGENLRQKDGSQENESQNPKASSSWEGDRPSSKNLLTSDRPPGGETASSSWEGDRPTSMNFSLASDRPPREEKANNGQKAP